MDTELEVVHVVIMSSAVPVMPVVFEQLRVRFLLPVATMRDLLAC